MTYSQDILREFVLTAYHAAGNLNRPDAESGLRKALSSSSNIQETAREIVNLTMGRWLPEQRIKVARALAEKGLPSLLDVLLSFDGKEQAMLRAKRIADEAEYTIVENLLNEQDLTKRQRLKLNAMLRSYDEMILRNPNSECAINRNQR